MRELTFYKMSAAGNDFVVMEIEAAGGSLNKLARQACDRKFGIGADGLLVLQRSKKADVKMRVFNADGSEAEMCGNGARCAAYLSAKRKAQSVKQKTKNTELKIETKAGIIDAEVSGKDVKIRLTDPKAMKLNLLIDIGKRKLKVHYIDTGVPHAVIFVEGLENIDLLCLGRAVRYHKVFAPRGANVNIVEALKDNYIKIRTYERGVEAETLACGTGSAASALITAQQLGKKSGKIDVGVNSGEVLKVYYKKIGDKFKDVWLAGQAKIIYKGAYYV